MTPDRTLRRTTVRWALVTRAATAVLVVVVAACGSQAPSSSPVAAAGSSPSVAPTPSESAIPTTPSPSGPLVPIGPQVLPQHGTFTGEIKSGTQTFPVDLWMDGCGHTEEVCGDIEYADPRHPEFTLCAPQLVFMGRDGDRDVFDEKPAYRADQCPPATLKIGAAGSSDQLTIAVDVYRDPTAAALGQGTLKQTSDMPPGDEPVPTMPPIPGLTGPLNAADLGGPTTPYSAADATTGYFPGQGLVSTVVMATGQSDELDPKAEPPPDPASITDPTAVTTLGDAIWITRGPPKTMERVDVTPAAASTLPILLPHTPYALAADGTTLWVTSLEDSVVMAVDTKTGKLKATIDVPKPAGVAVGGGAVWVVEHADGKLARIDPKTGKVTDEVSLGPGGDDPVCGMCAEDVIYAFGSAWTANDLGRSITRVDSRSLKATTIATANRVWSVAAHGKDIYGSQFEEVDGYVDRSVGGLVRIDPRTDKAQQLSAPGVLGVAALGEYLWLIVPGRRSDIVMSYQ